MNKLLEIFIVGIGILLSAIIINFLATAIGITTWYTFLINISENGFLESVVNRWFDLIFLILIYPFVLGVPAYYLYQFFEKG